jgi:hypothetical protein
MSDKEKRILEVFGQTIPKMTELEKERLLAFGEGIAFFKSQQESQKTA